MATRPAVTPLAVPAIEIRGLVKDFASGLRGFRLRAVDQLDLRVEAGQIYGLIGPNGSGKSTTIKVLMGLSEPTRGETRVFGWKSTQVEARREVGYVPESPCFYDYLSGRELVRFYGGLAGMQGRRLDARADEVLEWVGLERAADRRVGTYSKGMLQRVGLAQALVHDPRLLVLDEPMAGVDLAGAAAMSKLVLRLKAEGRTVLITSHRLGQIEELCDRVAMLERGRLVLEGSLDELLGGAGRQLLAVDGLTAAELADLKAWLAARGRSLAFAAAPGRLERIYMDHIERKPS